MKLDIEWNNVVIRTDGKLLWVITPTLSLAYNSDGVLVARIGVL